MAQSKDHRYKMEAGKSSLLLVNSKLGTRVFQQKQLLSTCYNPCVSPNQSSSGTNRDEGTVRDQ
jgi:hypothetical protein